MSMMIDALGYVASSLVLATFCTRTMGTLRSLAIASNVAFITYAAVAHLWPILILHAIMLPLNVARLCQSRSAVAPQPAGLTARSIERDRGITAAHARRRIVSHRRTAFCSARRDPMIAQFHSPHRRGGWIAGTHDQAAECGISMQS